MALVGFTRVLMSMGNDSNIENLTVIPNTTTVEVSPVVPIIFPFPNYLALFSIPPLIFAIGILILFLATVVGCCSNVTLLIVITREASFKSPPNNQVIAMAVAQVFVCLGAAPIYFIRLVTWRGHRQMPLGTFLCKMHGMLSEIGLLIPLLLLGSLTLTMTLKICRNSGANLLRILSKVTIIISCIVGILTSLGKVRSQGNPQLPIPCLEAPGGDGKVTVFLKILSIAITAVVMLASYLWILVFNIQKNKVSPDSNTDVNPPPENQQQQIQLATPITLLIITGLYAVTTGPLLLYPYGLSQASNAVRVIFLMEWLARPLAYLGCAVFPLVHVIRNKKLAKAVKGRLTCKRATTQRVSQVNSEA
ncbi:uncharacterized protein [Ptychodera flava]|uniref:uncharacterized protein n=1 Tax=Ptychodera flava TaxID=63121 RepID=UPI003969D5AA